MTEILKTLANGFLCGLKPGIGCADSAADIAGQFHWDLGEFPFEITDWQRGLVVDVTVSFKETDQHSGLLEVTEFSLVVDDLLLVPLTSDATDFAEVVTPQLVNATNNAIWTGGEWVNSSEMTVAAVVKPPADPSKTATVDVAITLDGGVAFPWDGDPPYFGWELGGTFGRWEDLGATRPLTFPSEGGTVSYSVSGGSATGDVQEFVVTVTLHAR
jgi:hypothetical protein